MLQGIDYCPILHARIAEMKALAPLSAAAKDLVFPLIVARPWPNAKHLERTWDKIAEAFGERRFALDLDRTRRGRESTRPAAAEFDLLFDESDGHRRYYELVESLPAAIPVLRSGYGRIDDLEAQLEHVHRIDRKLVLRLEQESTQNPIAVAEAVLAAFPETVLFVDLNWAPDLIGRLVWASQILRRVAELAPDTEIVVCGSSFPESFTNIVRRGEVEIAERVVYGELVRRHNELTLTYGDWASTRPPRESTPMNPVPRIDLPLQGKWVCFRSDAETYAEIASRLMLDSEWPDDLNIWGTYTIECTATDQPGAIKSPATATAVRVNIHMHRQIFFGQGEAVSDGEEPFTDDL